MSTSDIKKTIMMIDSLFDLNLLIDKIKSEAREEGVKMGYEEGYTEGYEEGYEEGLEVVTTVATDRVDEIDHVDEIDISQKIEKPVNWITRVDDGKNFWSSDKYSAWGISDVVNSTLKKAKSGDRIWFTKNKESGGQFSAVAIIKEVVNRNIGISPGVAGMTNKDFGWVETGWTSNSLLIYKNRINLEPENIIPGIKGAAPIRKSTAPKTTEKLRENGIDLDEIYDRFS